MNILNFIVIDDKQHYYDDNDLYSFTAQGECYIPLETPVPIIRRGIGCIGIGLVAELKITRTSTTIIYSISDISEMSARAYYDLYRNQATASNTEEYREDVIIPGMMRKATVPRPSYSSDDFSRKKKKSPYRSRSLMEYPNAFDED